MYLSILICISCLSLIKSGIVLLSWHRTNIVASGNDGVKHDNDDITDTKDRQHSGETSAKRGIHVFNFIRDLFAKKDASRARSGAQQ